VYLYILGSSGSYAVPGRPASGYLIEQGHTRVWCDAGPGTFFALSDLIELEAVSAVVISHPHSDHCSDLFAAFHTFAYGHPRRQQIPMLSPAAVWERMCAFLEAEPGDAFYSTFDFNPVGDGDRVTIGDLEVDFAVTDHSVPTVASRWSNGQRSLTYSADTGPEGDWTRLVAGTNLFLCEATYQDGHGVDYPHHLTATQAGAIARAGGADRLMLTHIPAHVDASISVEQAETTFDRPVALAVPGTRHKV